MSSQLSLDKKKLWMLTGALTFLGILIFAAGWLSGVIMSLPQEPSRTATVENEGQQVVRQKVPATPEGAQSKKTAPMVAPIKIPRVPGVNPPKPPIKPADVVKKPVKVVKTFKRLTGTKAPAAGAGATAAGAGATAAGAGAKPETATASDEKTEKSDVAADTGSEDSEKTAEEKVVATEAPLKETKDPAMETVEEPEPEFPYSIRLASYPTLELALHHQSKFREQGIEGYIVKVHLRKKGVWWRLFTGYYRDQDEAMTAKTERHLDASEIIRTRWANLMGVFDDETSTASVRDRVQAAGYDSYVIRDQEGRFKLFTGAFITRRGAEMQQKSLSEKGFDSKIVQR